MFFLQSPLNSFQKKGCRAIPGIMGINYDALALHFSPKQLLSIRESQAPINIWEGAVSSGKTFSSLWRFCGEARTGPEGAMAILTKTYDTFKRNLLPILREILGKHVDYFAGKREIYLRNRLVHVIGCSDERAEQKIRGTTFAGAYVDEATLIPETAFKMLQSRLRVPNAKLFCTTNPDSPYHWFKKDYVDDNPDVKSWQFNMEDNPFITDDYKAYIKRQYKGLWHQRYIEGKWVQAEGAIYDFFTEKYDVIDSPLGNARYYTVGVDYGTTNPCAFVLVGFNPHAIPNMWVEDEYYYNSRVHQRQKTDAEYADDLAQFIKNRRVEAIYLDPSAASFRAALMKIGVENVFDANNDVANGIIYTGRKVANGSLKICRKCSHLISEFQSYVWDEKCLKIGIDKPKKENDHALDALRYVMYSHFAPKEDGESTAAELEKRWQETMGIEAQLPRQFQQPNDRHFF